jgi:hypothetical protein
VIECEGIMRDLVLRDTGIALLACLPVALLLPDRPVLLALAIGLLLVPYAPEMGRYLMKGIEEFKRGLDGLL